MNGNFKISYKRIRIITLNMIILFSLLKPDSLSYIGLEWLDKICVIIDILALLILAFMLITRRYKISLITKLIILVYIALGISTLFISKEYMEFIKIAGPAMTMCLYVDYSMRKNSKLFIKSIIILLGTLYFMNFITIIIYYPIGMYATEYVVGDTYLMGFDNGMIYNLIPLCGYTLIYSKITRGKLLSLMSWTMMGLMIISEIYVKSGTGIIQAGLFILIILCINNKILNRFVNATFFFMFFYIGTIALTILRIQNYFSSFIVGVMGKDLTLTGRTYLWDYAIDVIKENFLFGIGAGGRTVLGFNGHMYTHPHCFILDLLYKGGIVMFLLFLIMTLVFIHKYRYTKSIQIKKVILTTIFVILFGEMANSVQFKVFFWSMFVMISYCDKLEEFFINTKLTNRGLKNG